jgi:Biotin-lipoyl like
MKQAYRSCRLRPACIAAAIAFPAALTHASLTFAETPVAVETITVAAVPYSDPFLFEGVAEPYRKAVVSARIEGIVEKISVQEGDTVTRGQILFEIDDSVLVKIGLDDPDPRLSIVTDSAIATDEDGIRPGSRYRHFEADEKTGFGH